MLVTCPGHGHDEAAFILGNRACGLGQHLQALELQSISVGLLVGQEDEVGSQELVKNQLGRKMRWGHKN